MRQHPRAVSHAGTSTPASYKRTAQKWGHLEVPSWRQDFKPKCSGCHRLTIEILLTIEQYWNTTWVPICLYLFGIFFDKYFFSDSIFSRNTMGSLQNTGVPILKNPPWDSVISLQTTWPWKGLFSTKFLCLSMGPGIFVYKVTCYPKLKWALDLFTRWPHYKITHKNPFCSGLKVTHFVWEIRRRLSKGPRLRSSGTH